MTTAVNEAQLEKPAFQYGDTVLPISITVSRSGKNYVAHLKQYSAISGCGSTKEAAVGNLIVNGLLLGPDILPINVEFN